MARCGILIGCFGLLLLVGYAAADTPAPAGGAPADKPPPPTPGFQGNPSFENGMAGWYSFVPAESKDKNCRVSISTDSPHSGASCALMQSDDFGRYSIAASMTVKPSARYRVSIWVRAGPDAVIHPGTPGPLIRLGPLENGVNVQSSFHYVALDGVYLGAAPPAQTTPLPVTWTEMSAVVDMPADAASCEAAMFCWLMKGSLYVDDFTFEEVDASTPLSPVLSAPAPAPAAATAPPAPPAGAAAPTPSTNAAPAAAAAPDAPSPDGNVVINPSFEDGTKGWNLVVPADAKDKNPTFTVSADSPHSGTSCAMLQSSSDYARFGISPTGRVYGKAGDHFHISFWIKVSPDAQSPAGTPGCCVRYTLTNKNADTGHGHIFISWDGQVTRATAPLPVNPPLPQEWTQVQADVTIPDDADSGFPTIYAWLVKGSLYIDDVVITRS